jgi:hypothetical protein
VAVVAVIEIEEVEAAAGGEEKVMGWGGGGVVSAAAVNFPKITSRYTGRELAELTV